MFSASTFRRHFWRFISLSSFRAVSRSPSLMVVGSALCWPNELHRGTPSSIRSRTSLSLMSVVAFREILNLLTNFWYQCFLRMHFFFAFVFENGCKIMREKKNVYMRAFFCAIRFDKSYAFLRCHSLRSNDVSFLPLVPINMLLRRLSFIRPYNRQLSWLLYRGLPQCNLQEYILPSEQHQFRLGKTNRGTEIKEK